MEKKPGLPVVEPVPIADTFVCDIERIEDVGGCARFVLVVDATVYEAEGAAVRQVVAKIVIPRTAIMPCIRKALAYLAACVLDAVADAVTIDPPSRGLLH